MRQPTDSHALRRGRFSRRALLAAIPGAALLVAGVACGDDDKPSATASPASGTTTTGTTTAVASAAASSAAAAFPVTIESALGAVTIKEQPKRVVTWGWSAQDNAIAMGVVPVGMPSYPYGGNADGVLPWVADALKKLNVATPELIDASGDEIPFEAVAKVNPDLVLAPYSGLTQDEYDTLSKIAPVVAYPDQPWATPWQDQVTIAGKALGLPDKAKELLTEIEQHIASLATQYSVLKGKTFFYGAANQPGQLNVYRANDPRVELLTQLGMVVSPSVAALDSGSTSSSYFYPLSLERLGEIKTDLLVSYFADQAAADAFVQTPVVASMEAVKSGHFAPIVGESFVMASSAPSALSIPWMLDQYVPQLAAAAAR